MTTLETILLLSAAYFAWMYWRLANEPMAAAVDPDESLEPEMED